MSLLSTDIAKVKRISLREVKLPAPEVRVETITPTPVEKPPTEEEIAYSVLVATNPLIEKLAERLALVSSATGERINKVELKEEYIFTPAEVTPQEIDKPKLIALAHKVMDPENNYTQEQIIKRIRQATKVSQDRAEKGFKLMLQAGAIEQTINPELYYLGGSTPF